jgi:hypothetical protein
MWNKKQKGGVFGSVLGVVLLLVIGIVAVQVGFAYITQQTIKSAVKNTLIEVRSNEKANSNFVKSEIFKKINVNSIDLSYDDVSVRKDGASFVVDVEFNKQIGLTDKAVLYLDLSFQEESPQ